MVDVLLIVCVPLAKRKVAPESTANVPPVLVPPPESCSMPGSTLTVPVLSKSALMSVVVPTPLLLNVPALAKRAAEPPKLLLLMSASSVALNVPLFWNSEPGVGSATGANVQRSRRSSSLRHYSPACGPCCCHFPRPSNPLSHCQCGGIVDRGGAETSQRAAKPVERAGDVLRAGAAQRTR